MPKQTEPETYDFELFKILAEEFDFDDKADAERAIKRKLRRSKLGEYRQDRVDLLRSLKNELQNEVSLRERSKYHVGSPEPRALPTDFDYERMVADYLRKYP